MWPSKSVPNGQSRPAKSKQNPSWMLARRNTMTQPPTGSPKHTEPIRRSTAMTSGRRISTDSCNCTGASTNWFPFLRRLSKPIRKEQEKEMYHMATLPNGKPIDMDMLETAMEDSDLANKYFLNLVSGEVVFFSDYLGLSDEDERLSEEIDGSNDYVAIERIPSYVAYQWMVDFVDEMVAPADEHAAEKLSIALNGKGAFCRFKDTLHRVDEQWLQAWQ